MSAKIRQLGLVILGWILVLLGIIGAVLPILPGIPLLLAGLLILGGYYAWPQRTLALLRTKAQRLGPRYSDRWRTAYRWLIRTCGSRGKA